MKTVSKLAAGSFCFLLVMYFCVDFSKVAKSSEEEVCDEECEYTEEDYYRENGYEVISEDTTWKKEDVLFFDKPIVILGGKTLTIEKGAIITFSGSSGIEVIRGKIIADGTSSEKIIFKKENEDDFYNILLSSHEYQSFFRHVIIEGGGSELVNISRNFLNKFLIKTANAQFYPNEFGTATIDIGGGKLHMENCEFIHSLSQDIKVKYKEYWNEEEQKDEIILSELEVVNTNFSTGRAAEAEQCDAYRRSIGLPEGSDMTWCQEKVYLQNNYYGDADGPNIDVNGEEEDPEKGFYLKGDFKLDGWSREKLIFEPETSGASSVLFLPGIKASHLYKYDSETDHDLDELWLPNWFGNDVEELELDSDGKSKEKVFTREGDVLDETILGDLYKSFLADLDKLKTDKVINDYKAFAYDWRQSVEDIVKNGTPYENNEIKSIVNEVTNLAQNSKSRKVTIVAHSNGGLVAKAAMIELEKLNLSDKVEKIIFVGTPQMGTPLAILSLLYGYEESLSTLLSQKEARNLMENMPGAYGLLLSSKYFSRTEEPIINFSSENAERGEMFREAYGENIDSFEEFRDFLLAKKDNREKPESDEINFENILNEKLFDEANGIHNNLDNWTPPANVKVIQLAGWGLPTVSGIEYTEKEDSECIEGEISSLPLCHDSNDYIFFPEPKFTSDGDAVITTPSGLMMPNSDNLNRFWFDLYRYNDDNSSDNEHANILEVSNIRDFLKNEIQNNEAELPRYISTEKPADFEGMKPRIKISLYSPLDIHIYDSNGNHTGYKEIQTDEGPQRIIEENIPNSYYFQLGERKYVSFEKGEAIEINLDGYGKGAYTLKIEEVKDTENGEEIINHIIFKTLPTSADTQVELIIPASGLEDISDLEADYDGDGDNDYALEPVLGEEVTISDVTPPIIDISSPENKTYYKEEMLNISYTVSDDRSRKDKIKTEILLDNQLITESNIDLSLLKTGEHKLTIKAEDEVNNKSEKEVIFNVETDIDILKNNINHFYDSKLIKKNQERKMIINNLSVIEKEIEFYNVIKNNIFLKSKTKKILLEIIERQIQNHIDIIIHKIKQDKKNYVTMIKEIVISDLEFIKILNN